MQTERLEAVSQESVSLTGKRDQN